MDTQKNLVITLGITGCGKSTWLSGKNPVVETDDLHKELLGDVSDISQERVIFDVTRDRVIELFETYDTVYLGATQVDSKHRISFLKSIQDACEYDFAIDVVVFDSDPDTSRGRIINDLANGIDRANSLEDIDNQYKQYLEAIESLEMDFFRNIEYVTDNLL